MRIPPATVQFLGICGIIFAFCFVFNLVEVVGDSFTMGWDAADAKNRFFPNVPVTKWMHYGYSAMICVVLFVWYSRHQLRSNIILFGIPLLFLIVSILYVH